MTNLRTQPQTTQQREEAVQTVGNLIADSHITPSQMARQLNQVYFCMVKPNLIFHEMDDEETDTLDYTFFTLIECLHRLEEVRVVQ